MKASQGSDYTTSNKIDWLQGFQKLHLCIGVVVDGQCQFALIREKNGKIAHRLSNVVHQTLRRRITDSVAEQGKTVN